MILHTDEQTIADLGIFGKRDREGIFDLYNRTCTRGGEAMLKDMFLHPLSSKESISHRCSVIEHFTRLKIAFPFDATLIDATEKYVKEPGEQTSRTRNQRALSDKDIQLGVLSVIAIIQRSKEFVEGEAVKGITAYAEERNVMATLVTHAAFEPALREKSNSKLSYTAVAAYDVLFRERERGKIEELLRCIYNLDAYLSAAKVAAEKQLVFPIALDKGTGILKLEGVYHPALQQPVANNISMQSDQQLIFLTGANMAGKSTFLRSVSTAVYVAHMGFPVAATAMEFAVMDGMYTTINLPDNLGIGASHFYAEVLRVKKVAAELSQGRSLFIVFDELFRGTNVKDAQEATVAVSSAFTSRKASKFIISSHIVEAGDALKQNEHIGFYYLPTRMNEHQPEYTYTLQQGITDDRHGMIIIRKEGILDILENPPIPTIPRPNDRPVGRAKIPPSRSAFHIDAQTLEELNLLGKYRQGSVYSIFYQVRTKGGEQLLDSLFHNPLTNAAAINERSSILQFFQQADLVFPFDVQEISMMREYLDTGAGNNALSTLSNTVIKKLLAGLTRDDRYKGLVQGFQATIGTLNKCWLFLQEMQQPPGNWNKRVQAMIELLSDPRLERLRNIDIYKDLPVKTLAYYDHLLKNDLYDAMELLLAFIYELDVYISVSDVARTRGFTYAKAFGPEKNMLQATGLYHPALKQAVGNAITMHADRNVLFLTGANMAGKSTWMKSVGIGVYLAHMGFPIAAAGMEFSVRDGLYSSINVADNISLGYSHFYAEVMRVKQAAEAVSSGKRLLVMFDELFKGTNVKDAYDGTLAVTEAFAGYKACSFIVSTHIIEVGAVLQQHANIFCAFMPTVMEGSHPRYTYRLQEGITEDRQGMLIIQNEGILELIGEGPLSHEKSIDNRQ